MSDNKSFTHILLVLSREQVSDWVVATLRSEPQIILTGIVPNLKQAIELIGQRKIDILLLDTAVPDVKDLNSLQKIAANPISPAMVLLAAGNEMSFVQQAIFSGARGFLLKPFTQTQLLESVHQIAEIVAQQRLALAVNLPTASAHESAAEIIAVFSPKGGVGCTSLATNLAIALKNESGQPVVLVDSDLQFGDVDIAVNIIARKSIADLSAFGDELEPSMVESVLIEHPSGIQLLLAPPKFDPTMEVSESWLSHVVKLLASTRSGFIVIDTPDNVTESTLNLLDVAQHILLVTGPTVASLRATKRFLELAGKMNYPSDKINLILSGHHKEDISVPEIERHLDWPLMAVVPGDTLAMALALNRGQPLITYNHNHAISKAITKLARLLNGKTSHSLPHSLESEVSPQAAPSRSIGFTTFNQLTSSAD